MKLSPIAKKILEKRFLKTDAKGRIIETPEDLFWRVAKNIALADKLYNKKANIRKTTQEFFETMTNFEFLPNMPTLRNAGRELQQLAACFVIPVPDSIEGIFQAVKDMALVQKSGGGTGFSFSRLRPEGSIVKGTHGVASGPVSFMKVFDVATGAIKEGGTRRGANMGILRIDHPDILKFITCKKDPSAFTNFNISVGLTKKFMEAVEKNKTYPLINPQTKKIVRELRARKVFDLICQMAHHNGEPGIIFIDQINKFNPTPALAEIESTNPCGEQPLLPYESCNLGSINLAKFVGNNKINWPKLKQITYLAVHFLDNVIDMSKYPVRQIKKMTLSNRKIGLGVMGFADLLIKLKIPYDSPSAVNLAEKIMKFINQESKKASMVLARERGVFPNWPKSVYAKTKIKLRNATTTTVAPTGTLSLIADCSQGIEPIFAIFMAEKTAEGLTLSQINSLFLEAAKKEGFYDKKIFKEVIKRESVKGVRGIPKIYQRIFVTANEIAPTWHLKVQAAFQKYTDNAVSKTVNLPNKAKLKEIKKIYLTAYKLGLKGLTVYRNKSRKKQILYACKKCQIV
jgi:ribonucleoside-diphosphate reductase alpha chain